jgi:uncharacterized protein (TIGR02453 family)
MFHPDTINFLKTLKENNNRNFFAIIKPLYEEVHKQFLITWDQIISIIKGFDDTIEDSLTAKSCAFRIYRDARRLKEWDPIYKTNFGFVVSPGGKNSPYPWYYLHIEPSGSFFAGGVYRPEPSQLLNLRHYIATNGDKYIKLVSDKKFVATFGKVSGECLTRPPSGFHKESPHLDLLMRKQHLIYKKYSDQEILSEDFIDTYISDCKIAMPWFHFLSDGYRYEWWKTKL